MPGVKGRSGGRRLGSGRKQKAAPLAWLAGTGAKPTPTPRLEAEPVEVPDWLVADERAIWETIAPHAIAERTLTPRTAFGFGHLCRAILMMRDLEQNERERGGTNHRGMVVRVEQGLMRYRLLPDGRPVAGPVAVADDFAEFDQPLQMIQGGKTE